MAATFMMKLVMIMTKKAMLITKTNQLAFLNMHQPVDGQPLGRFRLPEAEADAHGPAEEEDDVPGNVFQVLDVKDSDNEKENGGNENDGRFVERLQGRDEMTAGT